MAQLERIAAAPTMPHRGAAAELEDIAAFDEATARPTAGERDLPGEVVRHIDIAGENPVRVWRKYRGLKVNALADNAGISQACLSQIEAGKKTVSFRVMVALAEALDIGLDDLAPPPPDAQPRSSSG